MNDCIQNSDQQQSSNPTSPAGSPKFARSSSTVSSSSFDSCSDLLGSLESPKNIANNNAESTPDNQENGCVCGAEDGLLQQQPEDVSDHPSIQTHPCQPSKEGPMRPLLTPEEKNDHPNTEVSIVKDHTYGLSSAISFSKVKSLAENTVGKISQLQTSFRLSTSYLFPLKSGLFNATAPSEADVNADSKAESYVEHPAKEMDFRGDKKNNGTSDTNDMTSLSPKGSDDAYHSPCGEKSSSQTHSDTPEEGCSSQETAGSDLEQIGQQGDAKPSPSEALLGGDRMAVSGANDMVKIDEFVSRVRVSSSSNLSLDVLYVSDNKLSEKNQVESPAQVGENFLADKLKNVGQENHPICKESPSHSENIIGSELEFQRGVERLESVGADGLGPPYDTKEVSRADPEEADSDLQQLERAIWSFDLHKKNIALCHPLRTLSSGCGRPDLEDEDEGSTAVDCKQFLKRTSTVPCGRNTHSQSFPTTLQIGSFNCAAGFSDDFSIPRNVMDNDRKPRTNTQSGDQLNEEGWRGLSIHLGTQHYDAKEDSGPDELFRFVENLEMDEAYVDTVLDMEDILLNHDEDGSRERVRMASSNSVIGTPRSSRDGSLSSSTSGLPFMAYGDFTPLIIDWIEVVGAKQKKGGSSFGERIVGVKDHTEYCIKVSGGGQEWEVLRRYRDFVDLYHQLRRKFNFRTGSCLPPVWKEVERDSRKVFGSTHPNVIEVRSSRIEKCLQSLLEAGPPYSTCSPLYWFVCMQGTAKRFFNLASPASQKSLDVQLGTIESPLLQSPRSEIGSYKGELDHDRSSVALGKMIKLNLRIHPHKSLRQLLATQNHACAGCYKHLDMQSGLVQGFVQTLGWGKPRLCEYSGQLYCASCHANETAVLPAQVLWHWDFTPRRVSQLAKAYLDSIYDQPMLCVSAVNPYLYSRVPILSHVKETRKKLSKMLSCMLCPSRGRIIHTMASRRYLLENNDFFALRDLEDLSKGAFAALPGLLSAVVESLRLHITKQCSVCSESGEWCGAGVLCEEPFNPIFPFEEETMTACKVCHAPFHKACFSKYMTCPACPNGQSSKSEGLYIYESGHDRREVPASPVHSQGESMSTSSLGLMAELQIDNPSQSHRNWHSFYNLLPKRRLW